MTQQKIATIFGGTGFVGKHITRDLAKRGYTVKIATRIPESAFFLKPYGNVGQIAPVACNYSDAKQIADIVKGSDIVVNCIGILYQRGKRTFEHAHVDIATDIAKACKKHKVASLVHISALACERGSSQYAHSKHAGEQAVLKAFPDAVILRPSIIFGEDDNFFNQFARLAQILPVLPLIGGGNTKFQPVYVGDVADAVIAGATIPAAKGHIFELAGPETLTFKELLERMCEYTQQRPALVPLPFWMAKVQAFFLAMLPVPLLTSDQVESLKTDNVMGEGVYGLSNLGLNATSLNLILPRYLIRYRRGGRFGEKTTA